MPGKMDALDSTMERFGNDANDREVVVYEWARTYDESTGKFDYGLTEKTRVNANVAEPSSGSMTTGPDGGDVEIDVVVYFPPGAPDVTPAGTEERATVLEDTEDSRKLTVTERFTESNGWAKLTTVER